MTLLAARGISQDLGESLTVVCRLLLSKHPAEHQMQQTGPGNSNLNPGNLMWACQS
jgi:hypothetical protein